MLILKQKDSDIFTKMNCLSLNHELDNLDLIEKRGRLKEQVTCMLTREKGRPMDLEFQYMDEIRE